MKRAWALSAPWTFLAGVAFTISAAGAPGPAAPTYHVESSIPLADGGWDLVSFDVAHDRVLVARSGAISIIDLAAKQARDIGKVARGHAALVIPGTDQIAVTSGQDNSLRLYDAGDGHEVARVPVGENPDAAVWDPGSRTVVVMNAKGGSVSLVDPVAAKVVRTIAVKPALELAAIVGPGMLAVNDEDDGELELVDLRHGKALPPIILNGCEGPTGLAYDPTAHLSLSACSNGVAALVDLASKKVVKLLPIGQGPDTALFDEKRQRFLVPCGRSGTLAVFSVHAKQVTPAGTVATEIGARTAALDPATGRVFLPAAKFLPAQAGQRPAMVPGTAHLLVVTPIRG
jgi:DNA-binding beta-propeller fold protein YncE